MPLASQSSAPPANLLRSQNAVVVTVWECFTFIQNGVSVAIGRGVDLALIWNH